jgi:hypothetical protein
MPRGRLTKVDILAKMYKMKTDLYNGVHGNKSTDWYDGAHDAIDKVLNYLNEYSS